MTKLVYKMKLLVAPLSLRMTVAFSVITICLGIVYFYLVSAEVEDTCKLVHVVFRHGDRTPTETYENDPYKNYNWPDGWGALTSKGKRQLFTLGQTLRERYIKFFTPNTSPNMLYVRTSDADRCHMSGATFLAGFFPPTEDHVWNSELNWQPIPLHSLPRNLDNIVAMKKKCPTYDRALLEAYESEEIQNINKQYEEMYRHLTDVTGQSMYNITAVEFLFNTLEIEDDNGLQLPDWTKKWYPEPMKTIAARSLAIFTETDFMKKMKGGVMLKDMIQNMKDKLENKLKDKQMYIYSAHDITLINIMNTLGLAHNLKPEYGAAFIIEAHSTNYKNFEIKMLYYNNTINKHPYPLKLDSCGEPCYLDKFIQVTQHLMPADWEKECKN